MQTHLALARQKTASRTRATITLDRLKRFTSKDQDNSAAKDDGEVETLGNQSILAEIGIFGCESIEPLIIASLVTEDPLLLIGPHGTGKSLLLNRISSALGIEWRHYNASILNFDDLIGFPAPKEDGKLEYIKTENSIWGANAVFFDEISRCRPDIQNKMFPIVHERRVQGIELRDLRYRWAAMNPPLDDMAEGGYLGSEQLDIAFADRFALVIEMPSWSSFTDDERRAVVQMNTEAVTAQSIRLRQAIEVAKEILPQYEESYGPHVAEYVLAVSGFLEEAQLHLSPRRTNMLFRSILAVYATALTLDLEMETSDLTYLVLRNSLPMRCASQEINQVQLLAAHRNAWELINMPKQSSLRAILEARDPLARLRLAMSAKDLSKSERSSIVSDVFANSSLGSRAAIVTYVFEAGFVGKFNAAVAEELGSVYQVMIQPIEFTESVASGSKRYSIWQEVEDLISKLDTNDRLSCQFANYLAHLFARDQLTSEVDVHRVYDDWSESSQWLCGGLT